MRRNSYQRGPVDFDVEEHLRAVKRSVASLERHGKPAYAATLSRTYSTMIEDLWDAVTNRERIPRWFLPISGKLELGGSYQLEGNAGGVITACEPPSHLAVTWEFGGDVSWLDIRLSDEGAGRTHLALTHTALLTEHWDEYGPGAAGVGWELAAMGLATPLAQPTAPMPDEATFASSPDGKAFIADSSEGWRRAAVASGTEPEDAGAAARRTAAFHTGATAEPA